MHTLTAHALTPPIELSTPDPHKMTARRLSRPELGLRNTESGLSGLSEDHDDSSLLEQFMEQLADHKCELSTMTGLICQTLKNSSICSKQLRIALLNLSSRDSHAQMRITLKPLTVSSRVSIVLIFYIVLTCIRLLKLPP